MIKLKTIIFTLCILGSLYFLRKFFIIFNDLKKMQLVKATCTDFIVRTFYNKKDYVAFYEYKYKKETYEASDKMRFPILKLFIKINKKYDMYFDPNNSNNYVSPYELIIYRYYLVIAILLVVIPLLIFK